MEYSTGNIDQPATYVPIIRSMYRALSAPQERVRYIRSGELLPKEWLLYYITNEMAMVGVEVLQDANARCKKQFEVELNQISAEHLPEIIEYIFEDELQSLLTSKDINRSLELLEQLEPTIDFDTSELTQCLYSLIQKVHNLV